MPTKWKKINVWRRGICKTVAIRFRRSTCRVDCYRNASEQCPEKSKLELPSDGGERVSEIRRSHT